MANIKTIRVEGIQHQIVDDTAIHSLQDAALTGAPTAPTPNTSDNSTRIATTAFVQAVAGGGGGGAKYVFTYGDNENYEEVNEVLENIYNGAEIATYLVVSSSEGNDNIIYNPVSVEVFNNGIENLYAAMLDWSTGKVWLSIEVDAETGDGRAVWSAILPKPFVLEYGEDWSEFYEVLNDLDFPLNSPYVYLTYPDPTESFETVVVLAYYRASTLDSGEFYFGNGHTSISREYDAETGDYSYIWGDLVINAGGGGDAGAVEEKEFELRPSLAVGVMEDANGWNPNTYTGQLSTLDITVNSNTVESVEDQPLMYIPNPGTSGPWGDDPIDDWILAVEESGVQWKNPIHVRANIISPDDIKHEVELTELSVLNNGTDEILEGNLVDNYSGLKIGCKISLIHDLQEDVSTLHVIPYRYNINDTWTQDLTDLNQYVKQIQLWLCPAYGIMDEDSDFIATGYQYNLSGATERDDMMVARYGLYVVDSDSVAVLVAASDYEDEELPIIKIKLSRTKLIGGSN